MDTRVSRPRRARIFTIGAAVALLALLAVPAIVLANSGNVTGSEICSGWSVTVKLDNNVQSTHHVTVTSTIPGYTTTGITNTSYNTTGASGQTVIWQASGANQVSGTVTLIIYNANSTTSIENQYSVTLVPASGCQQTPNISTSLSGGGQTVTSITVPAGTTVTDTATVSVVAPTVTSNSIALPTGTVTFTYYASPGCLSGGQSAGSGQLVDGQATSSGIVFNQVGTYYWMAVYGGDNNYNGATSPCISEQVTVVNTEPSIATQLSGSEVMVGAPVNDSATLTGVTSSAGGTVTYYYSSTACGYVTEDLPGTLVSTVPVTDGVVPNSSSVSFSSPGTWYWWAFYSGDANNGSATSPCESEMLTVDAPPPPPPVTHIVIPTPTPFQSLEGATATPTQAVLGATGAPVTTPPPTSTGSNGSSNNSTPLFALLICLAFGGLGLLAVQAQRRSMRA